MTLSPTDNRSGVASTSYSVDGGALQNGTSFTLDTEGDHTVSFSGTDVAGNAEAVKTVSIKIDKTAPTIGHGFAPRSYTDGAWTNQDVSVTFECADEGGSGVASCTGDAAVSTEGTGQKVTGTATDGAGNAATDTALVSIDKTAPRISGARDREPNEADWYSDDVTVSFTATDDRSGVASKTADKALAQGANQSVTGTATDAAGNSASDTVSGINIDKTAPVLGGSFSSGWHTGDVTVDWTCTDPLSGPAAQPGDSVVKGEGGNLSATATCTDKAGNSTTTTVSGIQIDRTAPDHRCLGGGRLTNGWYDADVAFTLEASDNLSGIEGTVYSIDGGTAQPYSDAVSIGTNGTHTVTFWSTDQAGNVEDKSGNSITLKLDKTPPTLTGKVTTGPNAKGWYTGDVKVAWTCSDARLRHRRGLPDRRAPSPARARTWARARPSATWPATSPRPRSTGSRSTAPPPTTTASVPQVPASGWYGEAVQVTLSGHDNLSDIDATYYSVDGGAAQTLQRCLLLQHRGRPRGHLLEQGQRRQRRAGRCSDLAQHRHDGADDKVVRRRRTAAGTSPAVSRSPSRPPTPAPGSGRPTTRSTAGRTQTYGEPFTANLSTGVHTITYWSVDIAGNDEAKATSRPPRSRSTRSLPRSHGGQTPGAEHVRLEQHATSTSRSPAPTPTPGSTGSPAAPGTPAHQRRRGTRRSTATRSTWRATATHANCRRR